MKKDMNVINYVEKKGRVSFEVHGVLLLSLKLAFFKNNVTCFIAH